MSVLFCNCAYSEIIPAERKEQILTGLRTAVIDLTVVPDLCGLAADGAPLLAELARKPDLRIVACYPRAVRWLFHRADAPLAVGVPVLNMRVQTAEAILATLISGHPVGPMPDPGSRIPDSRDRPANEGCATCSAAEACGASAQPSALGLRPSAFPDSTPWFPVIDYRRCTNCKQCLEFCLFGVYAPADDGRVAVTSPANCKTNCPACARICPQAAIIFPKVEDTPINGAEIEDEEQVRANARINVEEYLGENVYAALAMRKMKRRALLFKKREDRVS